jgi:hypothetical protein
VRIPSFQQTGQQFHLSESRRSLLPSRRSRQSESPYSFPPPPPQPLQSSQPAPDRSFLPISSVRKRNFQQNQMVDVLSILLWRMRRDEGRGGRHAPKAKPRPNQLGECLIGPVINLERVVAAGSMAVGQSASGRMGRRGDVDVRRHTEPSWARIPSPGGQLRILEPEREPLSASSEGFRRSSTFNVHVLERIFNRERHGTAAMP